MKYALITIIIIASIIAIIFTGNFIESRSYEINNIGQVTKNNQCLWFNRGLDWMAHIFLVPDDYRVHVYYTKDCPDLLTNIMDDIKVKMMNVDMGVFVKAQGISNERESLMCLHYESAPGVTRFLTVGYNDKGEIVSQKEVKMK